MNVGLVSLGCAKNQVDSEVLLGLLDQNGHKVVSDPAQGEVLIVNTCGFVRDAQKESIEAIWELVPHRERGSCRKLIVMGCLTQRWAREIREEIPWVDHVLGVGDPRRVLDLIRGRDAEPDIRRVPGYLGDHRVLRRLLTPSHFAYLKIAEGCDNCCSYCLIPSLRGPFRSREAKSILAEARQLAGRGVRELALIAQDTTLYGTDRAVNRGLVSLLRSLSRIEGIRWLRLLYAHPAHVSPELIEELAANDKVCKYLDLPLQHCNDRILANMGRKVTRRRIERLVSGLRKRIPGLSLRTTMMVGFPGEGGKEFSELVGFVRDMEFDHLGAFAYSREDGTQAARQPAQVRSDVKLRRLDELLEVQREVSEKRNCSRVGEVIEVVLDARSTVRGCHFVGRTQGQAYGVDGTVLVKGKGGKTGNFMRVCVSDTTDYDLIGELV